MEDVAPPAETVKAYCKVCKSVVDHTVASMRGKRPGRVRCVTCEDAHPYRAKAPTPKKKKTAAAGRGVLPDAANYESLVEGRDLSESLHYRMTHEFVDADLVDHKKFGIGLVIRVLMDRKIEVLFPDGLKLLVHNR